MRFCITMLLLICLSQPAFAKVRVVVLGDSTVSGYMMSSSQSLANRLAYALYQQKLDVEVMDRSTVGATTADAYKALPAVLELHPDVVIVAVGSNDVQRGLSVNDALNANLHYILYTLRQQQIGAVVLGVAAPDARGKEYQAMLSRMYYDLTRRHNATLIADAYKSWRMDKSMTFADGIHPNDTGMAMLAKLVEPKLIPLINWAESKKALKK